MRDLIGCFGSHGSKSEVATDSSGKCKKKKEKRRSYGSKMSKILLIIIPWLHYHSLSLESESNKRIRNEASMMSRLSNRVWTKQQTDCTHQGHGLQSLCAVLLLVWKQVLEMSCPPGTLGALSICQTGWPDQSVRKWNGLFPEGFVEKPSPSCMLFRIWLIWLDSFD